MEWFVLAYAKGLDDTDGIVGLCAGGGNYSDGDLLIKKLYEAGEISKPVFGVYLGSTDEKSYLDIG